MKTLLYLCVGLTLLSARGSSARTWYIRPDGTGDAPTIQAAVDSADNGDVLLLTPGTYTGLGNRGVIVHGKAISILSEQGPEATIVDCQGLDMGFVFQACSGVGILELSGLTIRNAVGVYGGAVQFNNCRAIVRNNILQYSRADVGGGGLFWLDSSGLIENNIIDSNSAGCGGGIAVWSGSTATIRNNILCQNRGLGRGGGIIFLWGSSGEVTNNTIDENHSGDGAGVRFDGGATPVVRGNIISHNQPGPGLSCEEGSPPIVSCNDVFGNFGGDALCGNDRGGNFSSDPLFCGEDYFLDSRSPCAPANNACSLLVGARPVGCGSVAVEKATWGNIKGLYGGNK
jgi:hypothetical protein